jgi:hypothetical protein
MATSYQQAGKTCSFWALSPKYLGKFTQSSWPTVVVSAEKQRALSGIYVASLVSGLDSYELET